MTVRYGDKWPEYARQWDSLEIKPDRQDDFTRDAQVAINHRAQYVEIEQATGVPWWLIAAIHRRESDADFNTYLGNGEPLNRVTRLEPEGRGPFPSFVAGAIDALKYDGLTKVIDWRIEKALWYAERFNGTGYEMRGLPSPYLWAGSNQQRAGKFTSDGKFSSTTWDQQPGVAPLLATMAKLDGTIQFVRETPMGIEPDDVQPPEDTRLDDCMAEIDKALRPIVRKYMAPVPATTNDTLNDLLTELAKRLDKSAPPTDPQKPVLERLDGVTSGWKTIIGTAGTLFTWFGGQYAGLGPEVQSLLIAGFGTLTAVGVSAKIDRGIATIRAAMALYAKVKEIDAQK